MCGSGIITDPLLKPSDISYHCSCCDGFHCFSWQQTSCALLHPESPLSLISSSTPHSSYCQQLISMFLSFHGSPLPFQMAYCLNPTAYTVEWYQNYTFIFFLPCLTTFLFPFVLILACDVCFLYIVDFVHPKEC